MCYWVRGKEPKGTMNNNQALQKLGYKGKENNDGISFKNLSF